MRDMGERIESLDDKASCRVLAAVARAQASRGTVETAWTQAIADAVAGTFSAATPAGPPPGDGDLARAALLVLAEDPRHAETIRTLASGHEAKSFVFGETVAVLTAALVVLQTRVRFSRDKDGKFTLVVEKAAASDGLLKALAEKLLSFASGHTPTER